MNFNVSSFPFVSLQPFNLKKSEFWPLKKHNLKKDLFLEVNVLFFYLSLSMTGPNTMLHCCV